MLVTELITRVKEISSQIIRMILTGYADLNCILGVINKGRFFVLFDDQDKDCLGGEPC